MGLRAKEMGLCSLVEFFQCFFSVLSVVFVSWSLHGWLVSMEGMVYICGLEG